MLFCIIITVYNFATKGWCFMKLKLLILCVVLMLLPMALTGCSYISFNTEEIMTPPKPAGELYNIQQALESSVKTPIQLKYPTTGEHRSAFTLVDLDSDSKSEAVAFYLTSPNTQNASMHISLISQNGEEWVHTGDIAVNASDVISVKFVDIDNDGALEIIVGWSMYSQVDRVISVYTAKGGKLVGRLSEPFTDYTTCDLNGNGRQELLIIYQNMLEKNAVANLYEFSEEGTVNLGTAPLDSGVTSYGEPSVFTDGDGKQSVYIDATRADGMITEILTFDDVLKNACIEANETINSVTFRPSPVPSSDIDGDGIPEIPHQVLLLPEDNRTPADAVYLTEWLSFENGRFSTKFKAVMNFTDGYYLTIPEKWVGNISIVRDSNLKLRTFLVYDRETNTATREILSIQVMDKSAYQQTNNSAFGGLLLAEKGDQVYIAMLRVSETQLDITEAQLIEMFHLI